MLPFMVIGGILLLVAIMEKLTPKSKKEKWEKQQEKIIEEIRQEEEEKLRQKIIQEETIRQEIRDKLKKSVNTNEVKK